MHLARARILAAVLAAIPLAFAGVATAQTSTWPARPVRVVVPFPPGGTVDIVARTVAQKLSEQSGQPFLVENRAGANGVVGSDGVAKAAPDGYTLLVNASIHVINPLLLKNVPFDVERDFTAISNLGSVPLLVTAHPSVPATNLREFITVARADPRKYTFATSGLGSSGHLTVEMIMREAKLPLLLVAYKGAGPALNDLVGGQVSSMADPFPSSYPQVKGGRLKPLAVTSAKRSPLMPDVPTVAESGFAGFEMVSWYGLWGPAKLPREVTARIAQEAARAVQSPDVRERLGAQGFDPVGSTPEAFASYVTAEIRKYAQVIRDANIKVE
jgi:tripartite-type tricarboxylate transporter receptor subunit TctC